MSAVVGIDLGTTNTVVAAVRDGQASALTDEAGRTLIASMVSFHPNGSVVVGTAAKDRRLVDAANTIYSIKRLIGRSWDSEEVRRAQQRFPFQMRSGPSRAPLVVARGESYTLSEISAFVLRKAKAVAEAALGEPVERAVITVPANFNDLQRAATKVAGRVAGVEVLRIINEPTAAALAYGFGRARAERLAVYDLGGGTFDVTLLDLSQNVFEVLATAGDTFLGGDDIDLLIADQMADAFLAQHRYDPRADPQAFEQLRAAAEVVKIRLSVGQQVTHHVDEVAHGRGGMALDLDFSMTRAELDALIAPLVDRTFEVCRTALATAGLGVRAFDAVLLVGGATRMPLVKARVSDFFQREPLTNLNPDEVVAIGAAIQGHALASAEVRRSSIPAPPQPARRTQPSVPNVVAKPPPPPVRRPGLTAPPLSVTQPLGSVGHAAAAKQNAEEQRPPMKTALGLGRDPEPPPLLGDEQDEVTALRDEFTQPSPLGDEDLEADLSALLGPTAAQASRAARRSADELRQEFGTVPLGMPPVPANAPRHYPPGRSSPELDALLEEQALPLPGVPAALSALRHVAAPSAPFQEPADLLQRPAPPQRATPLLVDVTPLTLCVETVSGYCDGVISRNTPVPCERTREFVTAADGQSSVHVRIGQGESSRFADNTLLGEIELDGLQPGPRGSLRIAVTFALDESGILNVSAKDVATGRVTSARVRLVGLPEADQVAAMAARQAAVSL